MPRRSAIDSLPMKKRLAIEAFLQERGFAHYQDAAAAIEKKFGVKLSRSALTRFGARLEDRLRVLRLTMQTAREIAAEFGPEDGGAIGKALIRVAQTHLFDALTKATEAQLGTPDLVTLANTAAMLEKTRLAEQRRADAAEQRLQRAKEICASAIADAQDSPPPAGLSKEATSKLRAVLTGGAASGE